MGLLEELYRYREMYWGLVVREVRLRYQGSWLGVGWTLLNPLLQMGLYALVFSAIMRVDVPNYHVFVLCGLLPWTWFLNAVTTASDSIVQNGGLVKKIYFPIEVLPLVSVTAQLINFVVALPVLFGFLAWSHVGPTLALLALPLVIAIQFVLVTAMSVLFSLLNTLYRDVSYLLGLLMMVWFYLTPVLYPTRMIPAGYLNAMAFNPMLHLVEAYRAILLEGRLPSWHGLAAALGLSLAAMMVTLPVLHRQRFEVAEAL